MSELRSELLLAFHNIVAHPMLELLQLFSYGFRCLGCMGAAYWADMAGQWIHAMTAPAGPEGNSVLVVSSEQINLMEPPRFVVSQHGDAEGEGH